MNCRGLGGSGRGAAVNLVLAGFVTFGWFGLLGYDVVVVGGGVVGGFVVVVFFFKLYLLLFLVGLILNFFFFWDNEFLAMGCGSWFYWQWRWVCDCCSCWFACGGVIVVPTGLLRRRERQRRRERKRGRLKKKYFLKKIKWSVIKIKSLKFRNYNIMY